MVFARTKLLLEENCFEEEPGGVQMKFVGPQVKNLYNRMYELMKSVFRVPDSDIQETDYNWGKGEKSEKFKVRWWLHKDMDLFTYFYIRVDLSGQVDEKGGSATVSIKGLLRSEYPQDTVWQRSLFYEMLRTFWHRIFYHKKREEYAEECRHSIVYFQKRVRDFFEEVKKQV
jgi:hypothetical protein